MHPRALQQLMFGHVVDMAVERHRFANTEAARVVDEPLPPPTVTDDVQVQAGEPRSQLGDRF